MSTFDIADWLHLPNLATYQQAVDDELHQSLTTENPYLKAPLSRLITQSGKRLRSTLTFAAATSQGLIIDQSLIAAGVALELVHLASLVHDDLIDHAATRRTIPTINNQEGSEAAVLVGDYLLAKACATGTTVSATVGTTIADTIVELCNGQAHEMAGQFDINRTPQAYSQAISGKTAALLAAACEIGGLCAGLDTANVRALSQFGQAFGMSFQLIDDLLDFFGDPKQLGKPTGTDVRQGVYTLPLLLALRGPLAAKVRRLINQSGSKTDELASVLLDDGSVQKTLSRIHQYNQAASTALAPYDHHELSDRLRALPRRYLDWSLQQQVAPAYRLALQNVLPKNQALS